MGQKRKIGFREPLPVAISDFTAIQSHPAGVLPSGNLYLSSVTVNCNQLPLTEEIWLTILSYADGCTLARFVQTSRQCCVTGSAPELWRDLVLRECQQNKSDIRRVGKSWKGTYIVNKRSIENYHEPEPIRFEGIFSDYLYRSHVCRSFAIPEQWLTVEGGTVDRVEDIGISDFLQKYENANKPVVLKQACKSWNALERWKSTDYLKRLSTGKTFRATSGAAPLPAQFSMESYFDYCNSDSLEESPLYLFDRAALSAGSPLHSDFFPDLQASCPYFDPRRSHENTHDLFQFLGEGRRPDHTWLIVGPQRSGSSFHIDPNATHAWNACVAGRKRWIFYPPGVTPPGVHPSPDGDHVAMPISLGEWLLNFWNEHMNRYHSAPPEERPLECTVEEGDLLFVPHGWWHSVVNLDPINIAVTHNYVSKSNLPNVLRFLEHKQSQISGCRDRAESVKPERLLQELEAALQAEHPEMLEEARQQAAKGWTCPAWNDVVAEEGGIAPSKKAPTQKKKKQGSKETGSDVKSSILSKAKNGGDGEQGNGFTFSFL